MYARVDVDEPSVRKYREPFGAGSAGTPEPEIITTSPIVTNCPDACAIL
jgi:hypothetical protein